MNDDIKLIRLKQVLEIIPVSRSTWLDGVTKKIYPAPVRFGKRVTAWRYSDIKALALKKEMI